MNPWKLSTIVLASVLAGFLLPQAAGFGFANAQSGGMAKVQLDTSDCSFGVSSIPLPGSLVVQLQAQDYRNIYLYDVCQ